MDGVNFGDRELFEQLEDSAPPIPTHIRFTEDEEDADGQSELRGRLEESEERLQKLSEENEILRRKLYILTRPSGITVDDVNLDGPLLQILYANNTISKQCRQEIEDCICSVVRKHQQPNQKNSSVHLKPQSSAFALDEDPQKQSSSKVKTTTEAFKVVGSVIYFSTFSVDKLGQPLVQENPQLTDGWDLPAYQQVFNQVIGTDGQEIEMKDKRPKSMCFNCGNGGHVLRDCPQPKDMAAINERRKEFSQNQGMQSGPRYHAEEVEERFARYKPGVLSEELLQALGIDGNTLPPLIYRMRQLGYPPGWLKEAETEHSGLLLYDGEAPNNENLNDNNNSQNMSYDVSKLVDFPGFNVPVPNNMNDDYKLYGSIPMQSNHLKKNYATYLTNFQMQSDSNNKRCQESDSSSHQRKKFKSSPNSTSDRSSDMEIESDPGTPYHGGRDFQFQQPLPPGSPCFSSPPPLPRGTPPATPTRPPLPKGTPPPTPTNGSPAPQGSKFVVVDQTMEQTEDELTLEELEEQQRLIWAALEKADNSTNSDCETPVLGTPAPSTPGATTPAHADAETDQVDEAMETTKPAEPCNNQKEPEVQEVVSQSVAPIEISDSPESPEPVKAPGDSIQKASAVLCLDDTPQSPDPIQSLEESPQSPDLDVARPGEGDDNSASKVTAVPHRSKFASGIVPFEDTPEFTEVAEATGTYLRIRDLLKSSPRSLAKKK